MPNSNRTVLMREQDLIDAAVTTFNTATGLDLKVQRREHVHPYRNAPDAVVLIAGTDIQLNTEVKTGAAQINVGALAARLKQQWPLDDALLVAEFINPALARRLIDARIQFMDTAGNAYINRKPIHVQIIGNKKNQEIIGHTQKTGRAFQQTGMKVIFEILKDRNLLNAPYRQIADKAQVALGNIGWILNDLTYQGFVHEGFTKNTRTFADYNKLLNKWVEEYPTKLRAKLQLGTFTTDNILWWEKLKPENFRAFWGGELAANQYTHYLNPQDFIVYLDKNQLTNFLGTARLKKFDRARATGIRIDIFERFWGAYPNERLERLTHPIITYADLIETGDPRNLEVAERLRENYLH